MAEEAGLPIAHKPDSQEICFVKDNSYSNFIETRTGEKSAPGDFTDVNGRVLGRHRGIIHYTVGQRKGIGIAAKDPLFVLAINRENNRVILGSDLDLYHNTLTAGQMHLISTVPPVYPLAIEAKIRYSAKAVPAILSAPEDGLVRVVFEKPVRAITPGQSVVFYQGNFVLGGAIIESSEQTNMEVKGL